MMASNRIIDIRDIAWPICVLNCKNEVNQMKKGDQIDVLVKDIDVVNNLVTLIEQISNYSIEKFKKNNDYRLTIRKR